jgi:Ca2+-transporting ATPase
MKKDSQQDYHNRLSSGGLTQSVVLKLQEEEGYNELPKSEGRKNFAIILGVLKEPMVYILLACGIIYFVVGDQQEALMLLIFLFIIVGITIVQEAKAERALEALRDLSSPRANVLRDGLKQRIAGKEVVRGDIIYLAEGDRVSADAEVMSNSFLAANESLLTGEALPVEKEIASIVYAGTTIVRGQGIALVKGIGANTEIGKIGKLISK